MICITFFFFCCLEPATFWSKVQHSTTKPRWQRHSLAFQMSLVSKKVSRYGQHARICLLICRNVYWYIGLPSCLKIRKCVIYIASILDKLCSFSQYYWLSIQNSLFSQVNSIVVETERLHTLSSQDCDKMHQAHKWTGITMESWSSQAKCVSRS